ncbi:MAG: S1C family serine protease [Treponema sp.]|nr:S1C family serine protease [Treponema sp.]
MKNKYIALIMAAVLLFSGCATTSSKNKTYEVPDYSEEDVKNAEIERIRAALDENPVQSLWRATLVDDKDLIDECFEKIVESYKKSVEEKDSFNSYRLYQALHVAGYKNISQLGTTYEQIADNFKKIVPGLQGEVFTSQSSKNALPENVSKYIEGTVTVWIDQGIKIERGVGYADRVIGSGFFISKDGYIITNHHVIKNVVDTKFEGVARPFVRLANDPETRIPVKVIGYDEALDLALLKTEVDAPYVFTLGSSDQLAVGDKIYAIGSPVGLERTLTSGIVSAMNRKLFSLASVFQIDAAVNGGNSGGPCIDVNGNVQAIVFAGLPQYQGLNFAIPVECLKSDLPMLFNGGKREHVWIGSYGHTLRIGGEFKGVLVQYVMSSGSAHRSGLKPGYVIIGVNGNPVKTLDDLQAIMRQHVPQSLVRINYLDEDENEGEALVYLDARPETPGKTVYDHDLVETSFIPLFGMGLKPVSSTNSRKYAITSIIKGSIADESGFSENDPVDIGKVKFGENNQYLSVEIYARKQKKGYLDVGVSVATALDSPYYF